jgi:hypothetical protein
VSKTSNIYTVIELIEELNKYPPRAFVQIGICVKASGNVRKSFCARDLVHIVDEVPDKDIVLIHGEV